VTGAKINKVAGVSSASVANQWDRVAAKRDDQIRSGQDISYSRVLVPAVMSLAAGWLTGHVVDAGCGTGVLSELMAAKATRVVGVDLSPRSIAIARVRAMNLPNVEYKVASIERFSARANRKQFNLVVANMMLQDAPNLSAAVRAMRALVAPTGAIVLTITHPCFWPWYWGYAKARWFQYNKEFAIRAPFKISSAHRAVGVTTHFHRPVGRYLAVFAAARLKVDGFVEPMPNEAISRLYRKRWQFPRFLAVRLVPDISTDQVATQTGDPRSGP
jgi:2-polyprenyl-3-methyl-5-hydroxy-6-metoxy-1,4-benzoquinol methylase